MNVFMFHFGRCGSTVLAMAIARVPGFFWHGEIFSQGTYVYDGFEALEISRKKGGGIFDRSEFLDFVDLARCGVEKKMGHPILRYGCEIKSYHFEWGYFRFSLDEALGSLASKFTDARFIFLKRRNPLRRILSARLARETGIYHVSTLVDKPRRIAVDIDDFEDSDLNCRGEINFVLRNSLDAEKRYAELIRKHGGFELCYEDHIEHGMDGAIDVLSAELETQKVTSETHLKKTNPFPLSEVIINYEAVRARLSKGGFQWMLGFDDHA